MTSIFTTPSPKGMLSAAEGVAFCVAATPESPTPQNAHEYCAAGDASVRSVRKRGTCCSSAS
jgi:hypothetical protein